MGFEIGQIGRGPSAQAMLLHQKAMPHKPGRRAPLQVTETK